MSDTQQLPAAFAVLSVSEMYAADAAAANAGIPSLGLMEAAGAAVVDVITQHWSQRPAVVLCGPGNNGGDGYVVARLLRDKGWTVRVAATGDATQTDAKVNAQRWRDSGGTIEAVTASTVADAGVVVDALFGAGLSRALSPELRQIMAAINTRQIPCVGVDVPSGVAGDTGLVLGGGADGAPQCAATVTFFRPKPAHLLYPARALCGEITVADIGIPPTVLQRIAPSTCANRPGLWRLPQPAWSDHKYTRGHAVVFGGAVMTGAARLAARAARRAGAGLLTLAVPPSAVPIYAASEIGAFVEGVGENDTATVLADRRRNCVLIGPGCGVGAVTRQMVTICLATDRAVVLDADALTSFADTPQDLFAAIKARKATTVMTPHAGEFGRLFGSNAGEGKLAATRAAAALSGAVVVYKGPDTVVATPDGRATIANNAPPWLATGGSGDVLAGVILGLLAQGSDGWSAAAAGVWLHGAMGAKAGPGLIAEDLPDALPAVLRDLQAAAPKSTQWSLP